MWRRRRLVQRLPTLSPVRSLGSSLLTASAAVSACRLQVRSCCSGCVEPQYRRALTRLLPALTARTSEHLLVQVKGSRLSEKRDSTCFSKYPQTMHVYVQVTVNHDHQERSRKLCDDVIEPSGARDSLYLIKP